MKILFTGSSSFTGYWFIQELANAGHEVVATYQKAPESYSVTRKVRIDALRNLCRQEFECPFGASNFMRLIDQEPSWDVLCHHAADVTNYKSPDFDVWAAFQQNTLNASAVLKALQAKQCCKIVVTGSVFEQDEGVGDCTRAFSPYGLSKGLTYQLFRYYAEALHMKLGKFVIPNPFGPYEEPRFTAYLVNSWKEGKTPKVATPAYVRDNIHVDLLAKAYCRFVANGEAFMHPSGYAESQGAFTQRFASEMSKRLPFPCPFELQNQVEFPEPKVRTNTDVLKPDDYNWNENDAWDRLADYYTIEVVPGVLL